MVIMPMVSLNVYLINVFFNNCMFIIIIGSKTGNWKSWDAGEHVCTSTGYAGMNQESLANINLSKH